MLTATGRYCWQPVAVVAFYILVAATGRYRSFTACWMSLHANSCFVFINLL